MHTTQQDIGKNSNSITFDKFKNSSCFIVFDLTTSLSSVQFPRIPLVKDGHLRLTVEFAESTKCPVTVITMLDLPSALTIEKDGRVTLSTI